MVGELGVGAARVLRDELQQRVGLAAELVEEPVVGFVAKWGRLCKEHAFEQEPAILAQHPVFVAVAVVLGDAFEEVPVEQQLAGARHAVGAQDLEDGRDVEVADRKSVRHAVVQGRAAVIEQRVELGVE